MKNKKLLALILTVALVITQFSVIGSMTATATTPLTTYGETDNSLLMPTYTPANNAVTESPAWLSSAVINEVRIDTATAEGTFSAMNKLLPYYEEMGINCLWVLPVNDKAADKNYYTNYGLHTIDLAMSEASDYDEGWENFGKFVANAHRHNIRIMLDVVMWGVETSAPMISDANYSGVVSGTVNKWGGYSFNYNSSAFQDYYTNTMLNIIETTNIDGIRVDLAPNITNCSNLLLRIRQESYTAGHAIAIMSEDYTTDRTGGTGSLVYDLQQIGVLDNVNTDYWTAEQISEQGSDNWKLNAHYPANFWLTTANNRDIVTTTKNGKVYYGSAAAQNAGTTGENPYYTYGLSFHDMPLQASTNILKIGYQAILAPVIPVWYTGDEFGFQRADGGSGGNYYVNGYINPDLESDAVYGAFQSKVKKLMNIRRKYADIFSYAPANHKNTNICAVSVSGVSTYQAYARYANGKAVMVLPNGTGSAANITATVPVSAAGIGGGYTATNLMTGEAISVSNDTVTINVAAGDMAVILIDDGTTATTGSESSVTANTAARSTFAATSAGAVWQAIENLGQIDINSTAAIAAARTAYDALSAADKAKVDNIDKLTTAEKAIDAIFATGNSDYSYGLTQRSLFPDNITKATWGWSSVVNMTENAKGGISVDYAAAATPAYRLELAKAVQLDGAHLHLTVDETGYYNDKIVYVRLSSVHGEGSNDNTVYIKLDVGGGQITFYSGGAVTHSGMPGYNPQHSDRVFQSGLSSCDMKFAVDASNNLIVTINGVNYTIPAAEFARATKVYGKSTVHFQIMPERQPSYSIDFFHGGEDECLENVTQTGECDDVIPTESMFLPNLAAPPAGYGWTNHISRTGSSEGVRVRSLSNEARYPAYQNWIRTPVQLNGTHIKMTANGTSYNDRVFFIRLSNTGGNATDSGLFYRFDLNGHQLSATIDSKELVAAIDHSGYADNGGYSDRLIVPSSVLDRYIDQYEITFSVGIDESITMTVNGYAFKVKANDWKLNSGLTSLSNVYIHFGPANGGNQDYTLNLFHGGNDACAKLIGDINTAYTAAGGNTNIVAMTDLWMKMNGLSAVGKAQVTNYYKIASSAHYASNAEIYKTVSADISKYNWGAVTFAAGSNGLTINNTTSGDNQAYSPWTTAGYDLNGFEMSFRMNTTGVATGVKLYFSKSGGNNNNSNKNGLGVKLYFEGGHLHQMQITGTEGVADQSEYPGYNSGNNHIDMSGRVTENDREYTIKTRINGDEDLVFSINDYEITIPASVFSGKLDNTSNARIAFHPIGYAANYTIHYMRSGNEFDYDSVDSSLLPNFEDGDVNADGVVNLIDLVKTKKALANPSTEKIYTPAADLYNPVALSAIDADDLAEIVQVLLFK